jgi:hypothetical protein
VVLQHHKSDVAALNEIRRVRYNPEENPVNWDTIPSS